MATEQEMTQQVREWSARIEGITAAFESGNYDKAIVLLDGAVKALPIATIIQFLISIWPLILQIIEALTKDKPIPFPKP